jgi:hypothetical protein
VQDAGSFVLDQIKAGQCEQSEEGEHGAGLTPSGESSAHANEETFMPLSGSSETKPRSFFNHE